LEYFVAVARERSFSRGAQRVHVAQSAVSTAVAKLERELGVTLFDRSRVQIALTPAGETFLTEAGATLQAAHRAKESVADLRGRLSGTVDLGTLMSSGPIDIPAALGRFHRAHPLVSVRLRQNTAGTAGHLAAVAEGSLDLALVSVTGRAPSNVSLRQLANEPMVFLCRRDHPLAQRRQVRVADLGDEVFVRFAEGWGIRQSTDRAFAAHGVHPDSPYEVADYGTAAGLVRHHLGTVLMSSTAALRYTDLQAIPVVPSLHWTLSLAVTDRPSAAAAALAESIGQQTHEDTEHD
jgi:DNA-binding transcriptional LysR family regulator